MSRKDIDETVGKLAKKPRLSLTSLLTGGGLLILDGGKAKRGLDAGDRASLSWNDIDGLRRHLNRGGSVHDFNG